MGDLIGCSSWRLNHLYWLKYFSELEIQFQFLTVTLDEVRVHMVPEASSSAGTEENKTSVFCSLQSDFPGQGWWCYEIRFLCGFILCKQTSLEVKPFVPSDGWCCPFPGQQRSVHCGPPGTAPWDRSINWAWKKSDLGDTGRKLLEPNCWWHLLLQK